MQKKVLPLPGLPKMMLPRKGFTILIQPCLTLFLWVYRVGRLTENSLSKNLSSWGKDSFSRLKMSSLSFTFMIRERRVPPVRIRRKPVEAVNIYPSACETVSQGRYQATTLAKYRDSPIPN